MGNYLLFFIFMWVEVHREKWSDWDGSGLLMDGHPRICRHCELVKVTLLVWTFALWRRRTINYKSPDNRERWGGGRVIGTAHIDSWMMIKYFSYLFISAKVRIFTLESQVSSPYKSPPMMNLPMESSSHVIIFLLCTPKIRILINWSSWEWLADW